MSEILHIVWWQWTIAGAFLLLFFFQLWFWLRYMAGVLRYQKKEKKGKILQRIDRPAVSVVVCARNEGYNLSAYLPQLLSQDYPEYEVIVVNDSSEDNTEDVLERYEQRYKNLRTTFVPRQARVKSTKKLALTLAVKAAKYDYLVLTDADCCPESPNWLSLIMEKFTEGTEVVLGFGAYFVQPTAVNRIIQYDTLFNGLQYLGMAAAGHPYMGVGRNLAYRKDTFLRHGGFTTLMGKRAGDDDLFVNKVANGQNTRIAVKPESVTWSVPKQSLREWLQQKERHLGVAPDYRAATKWILTLEPLSRALFYGLFIALCVLGTPLLWGVAAGLLVTRLCWQIGIMNASARHFSTRRFGLEVLFFDIWLPLNTLVLLMHFALWGKRRQRW